MKITAQEAKKLMETAFLPLPEWYKNQVYKYIKGAAKEGYGACNIKPSRWFVSYPEPQFEYWAKEMVKVLKKDGYSVYVKRQFYSYEKDNTISIRWDN